MFPTTIFFGGGGGGGGGGGDGGLMTVKDGTSLTMTEGAGGAGAEVAVLKVVSLNFVALTTAVDSAALAVCVCAAGAVAVAVAGAGAGAGLPWWPDFAGGVGGRGGESLCADGGREDFTVSLHC